MGETMSCCPACDAQELELFYSVRQVPVQSMLLFSTAAEALRCPSGDILLSFCHRCGLISNPTFDPATQEFSARYEASQGFSATFNAFHQRLANDLIDRYDLRKKRVTEIGCGHGEFLSLLCELGDNTGLGYDPVFTPERAGLDPKLRIKIINDYYAVGTAEPADLICCKMTLEHIHRPYELLRIIRQEIGDRHDRVVFFQIPNIGPILHEAAFWEIYYEHCSYFSPGSLARLFRRAGFRVTDLWTDYADQYLMIEARSDAGASAAPLANEEPVEDLARAVGSFRAAVETTITSWQQRLGALNAAGKRVVLWGSGSRGVGFLAAIGNSATISHVVDINPHRQAMYMAGTGQEIVAPEALLAHRPDVVIVMNPIYRDEIRHTLEQIGLFPEILTPTLAEGQ